MLVLGLLVYLATKPAWIKTNIRSYNYCRLLFDLP